VRGRGKSVVEREDLDHREVISEIDRSDMLGVVGRMPEMISQAEKFSAGVSLPKINKISQVVVTGMGGSAIAGDIAADLFFKKAKVPILSNRGYLLPEFVSSETLFFALSYSGETEEVLSSVKEAEKRGAAIVCITSGGKLKEIAENKKYPLFLIPTGYQPRSALPYLLVPLLAILEKQGVAASLEGIQETVALLQKLRDEYGPQKPARSNPAKQLAKKLVGKIPLIFGSTGTTAAAALRIKTQFNENSKVAAIFNLFPELNHNEIVNLSALKRENHNFAWLVLRDDSDNERVKKRIEITKSLLGRQLGGVNEMVAQGKSPLTKIWSLILFGDYLSVYLAILQEIDPTPVEIISRFKKELMR